MRRDGVRTRLRLNLPVPDEVLRSLVRSGDHNGRRTPIQARQRTTEALTRWTELEWPGAAFVRRAAPSGRLAVLFATSLGARSGHDYLGCEHLVAGALRAGALTDADTADPLRSVAVAAVASSQLIAEVRPEQVDAWFADEAAVDPVAALASIRLLPTLSPRAGRALRRAVASAAAASALHGPAAIHVLSGVLEDPGMVAPVASAVGVSLEPARQWAGRRAAWGPLLELLDEVT
ncbi:MAG TPA: Clp protease N-terminal domain-containing protein [Acidimicrobiales bacterium]|nr:Clp protease N-terminal domain-containing protein [Acidimicrobiales bacterium]